MKIKTFRLGELGKMIVGGDKPTVFSKDKTEDCPIPIFSNGLENDGLYGYTDKARVKDSCLTISARGTVGAVFFRKEPFLPIVRLIAFVPNLKLIDAKYLYYYLSISHLDGFGTSQQQITAPYLSRIKISIFEDIKYQRRIASILSAYDNLMENNNRRIRLLEQMAENLYKEWFVRFRFPGHEKTELENSKLGKIPSIFSITKMDDVFEDYIGGGWGNDDLSAEFPISASVIRGADFPSIKRYDISTCPKRYHKISNYKARQLQDGDIVMEISGGTAEQPVGRTVLVTQEMINRFEGGRVICASFCKMIRLKKEKISPYYFYYWMQYLYDTRMIDRYQLQSTGIINFKFEYFLRKGLVMVPSVNIMQLFEKQVRPIFKEISKLAIQTDNLARQRDLLLPRLMSGKLEIKE